MSFGGPNSYSAENSWYPTGVDMGMPSHPTNHQNSNLAANTPTHSNYPRTNFKPNTSMCPPYNETKSFDLHTMLDPYKQVPVMNHPQNNNTSYLEESYVKNMPPNSSNFPKQNPSFPCPPPYVGAKNNWSNGLSNELNIPPPSLQNNFIPQQNFNNNFQRYPPPVPPQPPVNVAPFQTNSPVYNVPPPMHIASELQQNGQYRFMPPQMNAQNPPTFNNANRFFPPPTFRDPPPYPFPVQSSSIQIPPLSSQTFGIVPVTVPSAPFAEEMKLSNFLLKFTPGKKAEPKSDITVAGFRFSLQKALSISKLLQSSREKLMSLLQSSEEEWETEMKHVSHLKSELSEICDVLSLPSNLSAIQRKLKLIKKKRELKVRQKQENSIMKLQREKKREAVNQEIDKWLDTIKEKNLKQKREIEMKKEADNISAEVRKKIHEGKKTIEKIKLLEKLRAARQTNAEQKGLFISPEQSAEFESKISGLRSLLQSQLKDYEAEERALRVMLEEEQEGQLEQEAQWRVRKRKMLQQRKQENILESLFGDSEEPSSKDPLFFFFQHHNSANTSLENLVQIRHHWDVHLADTGQSIPQQWVVPAPPNNASWEDVCKG